MDPSRQEYIHELLKPLQENQASGDYFHLHQAMVDFDRCLVTLETRYADLYEQVLSLEQKLSTYL